MNNETSKQKVLNAASLLFFQKGFHGTSVRDIAEEASVNVSLISYYFKSKQGLFEYAVTNYYEDYLTDVENKLKQIRELSTADQLKELIVTIIQYKQSNLQLSCTIYRELSLNSVFAKEMIVTYLAKENHYISTLLFTNLGKEQLKDKQFLLMQLKGMLITPYILYNEWKYQVIGEYSHHAFVNSYAKTIHEWLDSLLIDIPVRTVKNS